MAYNEDEYLQLSGIQHFRFCRRQWALIHIEDLWAENSRTADGEIMHENAHNSDMRERRAGIIVTRSMPIALSLIHISHHRNLRQDTSCRAGSSFRLPWAP